MAQRKNKYALNVMGSFYVDDQCIACDACCIEAPLFFTMNDQDGYAYVRRQPIKQSEIEECLNALHSCPVEAIGQDGLS
jgi:ferredoxin